MLIQATTKSGRPVLVQTSSIQWAAPCEDGTVIYFNESCDALPEPELEVRETLLQIQGLERLAALNASWGPTDGKE